MADYFGKETPKLGFGLMRLPHKGIFTDVKQTSQMVDLFLNAGFTIILSRRKNTVCAPLNCVIYPVDNHICRRCIK